MTIAKETIPVMDLRKVEDGEVREAVRGFSIKNQPKFRSVIVIGVDGTARILTTERVPTADDVAYVRGSDVAAKDTYVMVSDPSDVAKTFLELTKYTCPHGHEFQLYDEMLQGMGFIRNGRGNYWLTVNGTSKTLFVAHLDTADSGLPKVVTHVHVTNDYVSTNGNTILGADDKAGLAVLFYLISQNVPGDYLLVLGEEVGCVGSSAEAEHIEKGKYDRAIQFDRAGTREIITHQLGRRTASRTFARKLAKEFRKASEGVLMLEPSDRGVYTDTKEFTGVIRECTNIAVGYTGQHTTKETQDMSYLVTLAHAAAAVKWETLPTEQDYSDPNASYMYGGGLYKWKDDEGDDDVFDDRATKYDEMKQKSMWEMWGEVDSGNMTVEDVRLWAIYNPRIMAEIVVRMIQAYSTETLEVLTDIEMSLNGGKE